MKTDDYFDQKDEVIEVREEEILEGIRGINIIRDPEGMYRVRISIGDSMYFDSPPTQYLTALYAILTNLKRRLR